MGRLLVFFAILTLLALEATIDATARGTVVGASGPLARADGSGPILVVDRQGAHRGAIGRGRVGLLVSPRNASGARAVATALAQPHQAATFALTAEMVIADSSLASDLRRAGHDVAYGGIGQFDSAGLPEPAWRTTESVGLRSVESAANERIELYAPPRLLAGPIDQTALTLVARASGLGLLTMLPATPPLDAAGVDGLVVLHDPSELARLVVGTQHITLAPLRSLAGLGAAASLDLLPAAAGELILAVARVARWAGDALAAAAELATLLYLARLITVVFVAARHARQRQASTGPSVRVAVLVPAYREEIVISRCVASLRASAYPDLQIVVIDDGSDDRTAAVAREAASDDRRVLVLQKPNGGKASALNHGLASTDAEVIVVVDADSIVERDALAELVKPLGDPSVGAVAGNVKVGNRSNLLGAMQHLEYVVGINLDRRFFDQIDAISVVPGALGAFRRDALESVGGFPTDTLAEDADLTVAIGEAGLHIRHAPAARAWTEVPTAIGALWRQRFRWSYGTLQVLWKHSGAPTRGATNVGRLGLPYLLVFGYLLPLLSPAVDVVLVYGVIVAGVRFEFVVLFALSTGLQLLAAAQAMKLDGESIAWALVGLPMQLGYRQLLSLVTASALWAALAGLPVGWGKLRRRGLPAALSRTGP